MIVFPNEVTSMPRVVGPQKSYSKNSEDQNKTVL